MNDAARTFWEDIEVGQVARFGRYQVTRDEVLAFAERYDPQPFHLSDEAAAGTHFGRLAASGWHTCAMTMRMIVDDLRDRHQAGLGSPGIDELRWVKPVFPGDVLGCETEVLDKRRSRSRPQMGSFRSRMRVHNQHGDTVMTMVSIGLIATRHPADPDGA